MKKIKIIFLGDIFGKIGRQGVAKVLPKLKKEYKPDLIIANAENLAHGRGITKATLEEMQEIGINFFTSGNHVWDKNAAKEILGKKDAPIIRPANYPEGTIGYGEKILKIGQIKVLVVNLIGTVFFKETYANPFKVARKILKQYAKEKIGAIIIDFHAEATSEKRALGFFLDGQVSAVLGTHTHVITGDQQILAKGTAYLSDLGMCGPQESVIGLDKETIINNFLEAEHQSADVPEKGICQIQGAYLEINTGTKKATKIEIINKEVKI